MPRFSVLRRRTSDGAEDLSPAELRLSDGRLARLRGYDAERCRQVDHYMRRLPGPRTLLVAPVHAALLALDAIEALDGQPLVWPAATWTAADRFVQGFRRHDLKVLMKRYKATIPAGAHMVEPEMVRAGQLDAGGTGMSTSAYDLAISISVHPVGFTSLPTIVSQLSQLQTQMGGVTAANAHLNKSLGLLAGGAALTAVGLAGVGVMKNWLTATGTMQDALTQVGMAAAGTQAQLNSLYNQSFSVATQSMFSAPQVLLMERDMARMGFRDLSPVTTPGHQTQRQVIGAAIAEFARAAEILQHVQGVGPDATVSALASQAHQFGVYSGAALARNVAWATGAGLTSHMTAQQQANVLRYLTPAIRGHEISSLQALALAAVGNQTGLTMNRGGSNIATMLRELAPTGAAKHDTALAHLEMLGGGQFYQHGRFIGLPGALGILNRFYDSTATTNEQRGIIAQQALLTQGSQAAAVLGSDTTLKQYLATLQQISTFTPAVLFKDQGLLNMTLPGQLQTLQTNLTSISALMGHPLQNAATGLVHVFVQLTSAVIDFGKQHPAIVQFASTFTAVATAAALITGPVLLAAGAFGLLSAAGLTAGLAFLPFTGIVLGVLGAVTAVTLAIQNWSTVSSILGQAINTFLPGLATMGREANILWTAFGGWAGVTKDLGIFMNTLGTDMHAVILQAQALAKVLPQVPGGWGSTLGGAAKATLGTEFPFLSPFLGTGGGAAPQYVPASPTHHVAVTHHHHHAPAHYHMHGVDHQTARDYAKTIANHVREHESQAWTDERNFGGNQVYGLQPGHFGA